MPRTRESICDSSVISSKLPSDEWSSTRIHSHSITLPSSAKTISLYKGRRLLRSLKHGLTMESFITADHSPDQAIESLYMSHDLAHPSTPTLPRPNHL